MSTKTIKFELRFSVQNKGEFPINVGIREYHPLTLPAALVCTVNDATVHSVYQHAKMELERDPGRFDPMLRNGRIEARDLIGRSVSGVDPELNLSWKLYVSGVKVISDITAPTKQWLAANQTPTPDNDWGNYVTYVSELVSETLPELPVDALSSYQLLVKVSALNDEKCHYELYSALKPGAYRKGIYTPVSDVNRDGLVALQLKAETVPSCEPLFLPLRNVFINDPTKSLKGFKRIATLEGNAQIAREAGVLV